MGPSDVTDPLPEFRRPGLPPRPDMLPCGFAGLARQRAISVCCTTWVIIPMERKGGNVFQPDSVDDSQDQVQQAA